MKRHRSVVAGIAARLCVIGIALAALVAIPTTASGAQTSFRRGPNPTATTLLGNGPFATSQVDVTGGGTTGFNNVTVCYPNDTSQGTFGGVVVVPGFVSFKFQMMWACQKIASHGFVVAVAETNTLFDFPGQRADQTQAIIRHLSGTSSPAAIRQRLDTARWAATGWSMGGGGALTTGQRNNPRIEAVVAFEPWEINSYGNLTVPSLIFGATNDFIAAPGTFAEPFYTQITQAEKFYLELANEDHFVGSRDNQTQSAMTIAWLKRWVDNDTRYDPFICPPPTGTAITETRSSCPLSGS